MIEKKKILKTFVIRYKINKFCLVEYSFIFKMIQKNIKKSYLLESYDTKKIFKNRQFHIEQPNNKCNKFVRICWFMIQHTRSS